MERFEDNSQWIDAASTQRGASQDRDRRIAEKIKRLNQASMVEACRRVDQMEITIASFEKTIRDLQGWIEAERSRPDIHYPSTLANSLTQRRDTLNRSIEELKRKLAETRHSHSPIQGVTELSQAFAAM
jgi:hypothetical protein